MKDDEFRLFVQHCENQDDSHSVSIFSDVPLLSPSVKSVNLSEPSFDFNDALSSPSNVGRVSCSDFLAALQGLDSPTSQKSQHHTRNLDSFDGSKHQRLKNKSTTVPPDLETKSLGNHPCTAFCPLCDTYVHTSIELAEGKLVPKILVGAFSSFFHCCSFPGWIKGLQVHKCPNCDMVLARTAN